MKAGRTFAAAVILSAAVMLCLFAFGIARCDEPIHFDCQPRGYVALASFRNFKDIPDKDVFFHAGGDQAFELPDSSIVDPDLQCASAEVHWFPGFNCVGEYTYQYPGVLFPDGHPLADYQVRWDILCADIASCAMWPYQITFPNNNHYAGLFWHGERLNVQDADRNVVFIFSPRGQGQGWMATLVANMVVQSATSVKVVAVCLVLPKRFGRNGQEPEVELSIAQQGCP